MKQLSENDAYENYYQFVKNRQSGCNNISLDCEEKEWDS